MAIFPNAEQAAALRRFEMLRTDELPMVAAQLLVDLDSSALRRLAGLDTAEAWLINQVWTDVLSELGIGTASLEHALAVALTFEIAAWRAGQKSILDVIADVERFYVQNDYPTWATEAAHLYALADELGGWGRTRDEVLADAVRTLEEFEQRPI